LYCLESVPVFFSEATLGELSAVTMADVQSHEMLLTHLAYKVQPHYMSPEFFSDYCGEPDMSDWPNVVTG